MINYERYINQATFKNDLPNPKISRVRMILSKENNPNKNG